MTSPTLEYATVTGRIAISTADKATDGDEIPELVYADGGKVVFTPLVEEVTTAAPPVVIVPDTITATVDITGHLSLNGQPEVEMLDLGSDLIAGSIPRDQGAYRVDLNVTVGGKPLKLSSFYCNPAAGVTNDLAVLMTPTTVAGQPIVVGPGVAPGGAMGEVLVKRSDTDYDTGWQAGTANSVQQVLGTGMSPIRVGGYGTAAPSGLTDGDMILLPDPDAGTNPATALAHNTGLTFATATNFGSLDYYQLVDGGGNLELFISVARTTSTLTASASGDISPDVLVATLSTTAKRPQMPQVGVFTATDTSGSCLLGTDGTLKILDAYPSSTIVIGDTLKFSFKYALA